MALAESEPSLDWDPEIFESALDLWRDRPGRLLELLRRMRADDALLPVSVAAGLDEALRRVRSLGREPHVLVRAPLPSELRNTVWPRWTLELATELLLDIAGTLQSGTELRLSVDLREWSLELECDASPLGELGCSCIAGPLLRTLGCASMQSGAGRWLLACSSPLNGTA